LLALDEAFDHSAAEAADEVFAGMTFVTVQRRTDVT
jgi:hypothetical protein